MIFLFKLKRFSESFIRKDLPKKLLTDFQNEQIQVTDVFTQLNDTIRQSSYYQQLPELMLSCDDLDGLPEQLPIIFEENYINDCEYADTPKTSLTSFSSDSNLKNRRQFQRKTSQSSNEFSTSSSSNLDSAKLHKKLKKKI